jgi:hypothetical protein
LPENAAVWAIIVALLIYILKPEPGEPVLLGIAMNVAGIVLFIGLAALLAWFFSY